MWQVFDRTTDCKWEEARLRSYIDLCSWVACEGRRESIWIYYSTLDLSLKDAMVWKFVLPSNAYVEMLMPNVVVLEGGTFERCLG